MRGEGEGEGGGGRGGGEHESPHHNFVVIAWMIMKFAIGIKLDYSTHW